MILCSFSSVLYAFEEPLKNVYQEKRSKEIFKSLRCAVCAGQSIDDSDTQFARSIRSLVRTKVAQGSTDEQIYDLLKHSYGEAIMFRPPFNDATALLWILPFALIFLGFISVIFVLRKSKA